MKSSLNWKKILKPSPIFFIFFFRRNPSDIHMYLHEILSNNYPFNSMRKKGNCVQTLEIVVFLVCLQFTEAHFTKFWNWSYFEMQNIPKLMWCYYRPQTTDKH